MELIRALGPALAVTVLTAMLVALTLAPALIGIFGNVLFWPGPGWYRKARRAARAAPPRGRADQQAAGVAVARPGAARRAATFKPVALIIAAACVVAMVSVGLKATGCGSVPR